MTPITSFRGKNRFLSNFYVCHTLLPTLEHHFQAAKTLDPNWKLYIMSSGTPGIAKQRGRSEKLPLRPDWDDVKDEIMLKLVRMKFTTKHLAVRLIETEDAELIEGNNWHDNYWGSCRCSVCSYRGSGSNKLGEILMVVRKELQEAAFK